MSFEEFAAKGVRGLTSRNTVAKYRKAWDWAVDAGQAAGQIATGREGDSSVRSPDTRTLKDLGIKRQRLTEARLHRDNFAEKELREIVAEAIKEDKAAHGDRRKTNRALLGYAKAGGRTSDKRVRS